MLSACERKNIHNFRRKPTGNRPLWRWSYVGRWYWNELYNSRCKVCGLDLSGPGCFPFSGPLNMLIVLLHKRRGISWLPKRLLVSQENSYSCNYCLFFPLLVVIDSVKYILLLTVQTPGIYLENILGLKCFSYLRVLCVYKGFSNKSYIISCNNKRACICTSMVSFINFNLSVTWNTFLVLFPSVLGWFPVIVNACVPGLLLLYSSLLQYFT